MESKPSAKELFAVEPDEVTVVDRIVKDIIECCRRIEVICLQKIVWHYPRLETISREDVKLCQRKDDPFWRGIVVGGKILAEFEALYENPAEAVENIRYPLDDAEAEEILSGMTVCDEEDSLGAAAAKLFEMLDASD